jgi:hypothetical protein
MQRKAMAATGYTLEKNFTQGVKSQKVQYSSENESYKESRRTFCALIWQKAPALKKNWKYATKNDIFQKTMWKLQLLVFS